MKKISGILGQRRAVAQLTADAEGNRLAHAYLFVGPAGVGRASTALALLTALLCNGSGRAQSGFGFGAAEPVGDENEPCGGCGPCRRIARGQFEDLMVVAPPTDAASSQIKVEEVREVIRAMGFAPISGWRLVLIKNAGHLNPTSGNALLKTLEEPPPGNILVLTVQDPAELLPTLVSRCRKVGFAPLPPDLVEQELVRRGVEPEAARLKAAVAGGSLGRALALDHEELAESLSSLVSHLARRAGPAADLSFAEQLVAAFRAGPRIDREGLVEALDLLALYFRDQAVTAAGRATLAHLPFDGAGGFSIDAMADCFARVRRGQAQILRNAAPELAVAVLMNDLRRIST